ncbi:hypothetical protein EYZ11_008144 [Aspergillus tanneri]|uniref:Cellobiose dehydrogenase cytochrome domain-containing protein n=1 Tax=Aspergillus tanneri TaxID=1220188 RepID=A0A4S3JDF6_9EURO|nr:hypothetical protein EYZ11_008144 [Aspergillus tanneri]
MHFTVGLISALAVTTAEAYLVMTNPIPYGKATLNNSPLAANSSDFPCKQCPGVYNPPLEGNKYTIGLKMDSY